ncbi:MAG: L-fucose:H+ symporter permease [Bacteroidales bacterium]|nr:L-fucose:H+ symporter permease [Bacteroidales bacterium]
MKRQSILKSKDGVSYVLPFLLVTCCFALWGFANDITNPMVKSFSKIFRMSVTDGALVQLAFYGGYFCMALPAALFIKKFNYKSGILMGLGLYAIGALMFIPAARIGNYYPFLVAYFILTCGLSFLETSANPFILAMGDRETATRRLNFAQSFNPIGSLCGMFVAMKFIQSRMNPMSSAERATLDDASFEAVKSADLAVIAGPYVTIGLVLVVVFILILLMRNPVKKLPSEGRSGTLGPTVGRLWKNKAYRNGVIAQFFYVGAQITCWTFIIQYGTSVLMPEYMAQGMEQGLAEQTAEKTSQMLNIVAMVCFCSTRFISTWLMKYFKPARMLAFFAAADILLTLGVIFIGGRVGLGCLVGVSVFMSLMFPTIYGLALGDVGNDTEIGAAGLIMAILGGSVLPPLQASIIDRGVVAGLPGVNVSFVVPLICFVAVLLYGRSQSRIAAKATK